VKHRSTHRYDAPIEDVWAMYRDPAAYVARYEHMGHEQVEVAEQEITDDAVLVVVRGEVHLNLSGVARRIFPSVQPVEVRETWKANGDGTFAGRLAIRAGSAPVHIAGETTLSANGTGGTLLDIEVDLSVEVPVVGSQLTSLAVKRVQKQLDNVFAAGDAWLAEQ
jgi:carbon monoxide dehydrogenase subunit G